MLSTVGFISINLHYELGVGKLVLIYNICHRVIVTISDIYCIPFLVVSVHRDAARKSLIVSLRLEAPFPQLRHHPPQSPRRREKNQGQERLLPLRHESESTRAGARNGFDCAVVAKDGSTLSCNFISKRVRSCAKLALEARGTSEVRFTHPQYR